MDKLYKKNENTFAVILIVIYVVGASIADNLSESIGAYKSVTLLFNLIMSLVLFSWIKKNNLMERFGLKSSDITAKRMLYYLPFVYMIFAKYISGIKIENTAFEIALFIGSMMLVGFLEELIFRGFLFNSMKGDGLVTAIAVSSLTFGIGHIVNLFNASGQNLYSTIGQIVFAVIVGFAFTMVYYKSKSLIACILTHGLYNSSSILTVMGSNEYSEGSKSIELVIIVTISAVLLLYGIYMFSIKRKEKN